MTRVALISDLHFGREDKELVSPLLAAIKRARPDYVVVAGDFVQRARAAQFRPAKSFLDALDSPWMAVPGNHDIPLYNIPARLLRPRAAYRRWIADDVEPLVRTGAATLVGVDTTDVWRIQRGRIDAAQVERVCTQIRQNDGRLVIVVAHHPFHQNPEVEKKLMRGAADALDAWAECGPHVILCGHLHHFHAEPFITRKGAGQTLQVHCGTSISTRHRGNPNDLAILDITGSAVEIVRETFDAGRGFTPHSTFTFVVTPSGWRLCPEATGRDAGPSSGS